MQLVKALSVDTVSSLVTFINTIYIMAITILLCVSIDYTILIVSKLTIHVVHQTHIFFSCFIIFRRPCQATFDTSM